MEDSSYQQPMTPRRVKRQSRHRASGRSQTRSNGSSQGRASQRSRRHQYLNPVNRLMDKANESSTSTDSCHPPGAPHAHTTGRQGHSNPMYVHSRPNSTYSINSPPPGHDPLERPPSVHSSYSNYHGQRPSLNPNPYGRPPVQQAITAGLIGSSHQRRAQGHVNGHAAPGHGGTLSSLRSSTYSSGGTMKVERERPPPYMFGVNSETVIWLGLRRTVGAWGASLGWEQQGGSTQTKLDQYRLDEGVVWCVLKCSVLGRTVGVRGASLGWEHQRGEGGSAQTNLDECVAWCVLKCSGLESVLHFAPKQGSQTGPLSVIFQRLYILWLPSYT